jgi:hypothetical protein
MLFCVSIQVDLSWKPVWELYFCSVLEIALNLVVFIFIVVVIVVAILVGCIVVRNRGGIIINRAILSIATSNMWRIALIIFGRGRH